MNFLDPYAPYLKAALRIVAGLLFLHFGLAKIFHFPIVPMFAAVTPTEWPEGPAGLIELITGALLVLGFFSRYAAFIASGEMAIAYFLFHFPRAPLYPAINGGSLAILFCFVFLYLAASPPGPL